MRFLVGSCYFFSRYPDFVPHDVDYIELVDSGPFKRQFYIRRGDGKDIVLMKKIPLPEMLKHDLDKGLPMYVIKYLVPEFSEAMGFSFGDLPKLQPKIDALDDKHLYIRTIYEAYLKNGSFTLTEDQRLEAYASYRSSRGLPPHNPLKK